MVDADVVGVRENWKRRGEGGGVNVGGLMWRRLARTPYTSKSHRLRWGGRWWWWPEKGSEGRGKKNECNMRDG